MAKPANIRNTQGKTPAKSAVAAAVIEKMKPATIPVVGSNISIIGKGTESAAHGMALADSHWNSAVKESAGWRERFLEVVPLRGEALANYKKGLNAHKKEQIAQSKATGVALSRSAGVRLSECLTVAKAAGKGMSVENILEIVNSKGIGKEKTIDTVAHAAIVTAAREWSIQHNADGSTVSAEVEQARRGRKELPIGDKIKRLILRSVAIKDLGMVASLAASLAKRVKTQADVDKELSTGEAKKIAKKDEQRKVSRVVTPAKAAA